MEPPLNHLPPELIAMAFESLDKEERTLCVMSCHRWRALIKGLWPALKTDPNNLLIWTAETGGTLPLMKYANKWGATMLDKAISHAKTKDHIACLKLLKNWDDCYSFYRATAEDHTACSKQPKRRGEIDANEFLELLRRVAEQGHLNCLKLLKEWDPAPGGDELPSITATSFDEAFCYAALGGHVNCLKLLKEWGATDFDGALGFVAVKGPLACEKWTNFNWLFEKAKAKDIIDCLKLLKEWGATNFDTILEETVSESESIYRDGIKGWDIAAIGLVWRMIINLLIQWKAEAAQ